MKLIKTCKIGKGGIRRVALVATFACCMASMAYETYTDGNGVEWKYTVLSGTDVSLGTGTTGDQAIGNNVKVDAADIPWTFEKDGTTYTVTKVSAYAFRDCNRTKDCLTGTLAFPDSVTEIGNYAFLYCSNLTSVAFNPNIKTIGQYAFGGNPGKQGCVTTTITDFDLSGCSSVGKNAFADMGRDLNQSDRPHARLLLTNPSLTTLTESALAGCKASYIDVVLGRSVVTLTASMIFQNSYYTGLLIPGPQVVSSGTQTYTSLSKNNTFNWSTSLELVFLGPTVKPSGTDKTMFNYVTGSGNNVKIYAPYQHWNGTTWQNQRGSNPGTLSATLYGHGQAVDFALDDDLSLLTATPTTEAALVDVLTYAPQFKSRFGLDTKICVTNALTSTGLVTKQMLQTASVTFDSLTFAARTQTELDNVLDITPVDVPLVIDPAGATDELRLTTQTGRKIHVLLPEGGSYRITHNGLMIIVK